MSENFGCDIQSAQIQKLVEHGMPEKIVKTIQYTLRKRAAEQTATITTTEGFAHDNVNNVSGDGDASNQTAADSGEILGIPRLCGRFRKLQNDSKLGDKVTDIGATGTTTVEGNHAVDADRTSMDGLAAITQMTKHFVQRIYGLMRKMQSSKIYMLLTRTTQPAHLIVVGILTFVLFTVWPDIIDSRNASGTGPTTSDTEKTTIEQPRTPTHNTLAMIAYLGAFATHFGAQIWMTFISGLSLYFALPRHTFGQCQQILFPRYFALSSMLSVSMLILFVKYFLNSWNTVTVVQLMSLAATAFIEIMIRLYLAPPMLRLMLEKYRIEGAIGSGREVGTLEQGDLINCPHYQHIHKTFRRIHMTIAIGNMTVLLATCFHLYILASKIQIS